MADGKKGFIIYCAWKDFLNELDNDQLGQWTRWVLNYCDDLEPSFPENTAVRMACRIAKTMLKNDLDKYNKKVERFKKIGKQYKNTEQNDTENDTENDTVIATDFGGDKDKVKDKVKDKDKDKDNNISYYKKESIKENEADESSSSVPSGKKNNIPSKPKPVKHKYGQYEQVLLTDNEYKKLSDEFGEGYLLAVIDAIDESKKITGNKNKWKDDNLVIRKAIREQWTMLKNIDPSVENSNASKRKMDAYDDDFNKWFDEIIGTGNAN